tara:strand:+ start:409 stop:768 length:360 start_codon:yes stop_codon:yes gene_type:complete
MSKIIQSKSNKDNYKQIAKFTWLNGKLKTTIKIEVCKNWHWVKFDNGKIHKVDHARIYTTKWRDPYQKEIATTVTGDMGYRSVFMQKINPKSFIKEVQMELNNPKKLRKFNKGQKARNT